ncbi:MULTISPECIES: WXG100 family type VII secretion target [unclassified Streptomyces]|uniref:WXG100 family type VII secretion target n=1 Tax=unclassified Streptomyces TaxID=2593676 RepID=UPI000DAC00E3|nr:MULTISPECIES: WXG100 family type VII secretion target [unclassified Streptomyces]PZT72318.1 WXG100 family type VII secretion target [Streptomyces sp. AC1-42T]PZT81359.1 WXG100 family type VII secretion target [Streptomyces sp. AC1-42W]
MPDDEHITVGFATLQRLSGELEDILKRLNEQLDLLYSRAEKVVLTWEGETREVFIDELDKWGHSAQDLRASQKWLHEVVTKGHINYAAAHRAVLRGWGAG